MARVLLGFGGNLGDPIGAIETAQARLAEAGVAPIRRSSFYRTPPWGERDQPDFVNGCLLAETTLAPEPLLGLVKRMERDIGREPARRWGPRLVDIDILDYEGAVRASPDLTIPHSHLTARAFVLVPLAEIVPDWIVAGRTIAAWASSIDATGIVRLTR